MPKLKRIPKFANEAKEQDFWAKADTTDYFDWSKAQRVQFPNLKPTTTPISMRLPETMLSELKRLANEQDVPYQSLMKVYLAERIADERQRRDARPNKASQPTKPRRRTSRKTAAR
jgi:predicted DNA binding CopG/RHH family protein